MRRKPPFVASLDQVHITRTADEAIIDGGPNTKPVIHIDDQELSWQEFGRLLTTYAGWGMRVIFVPDDETHIQPPIEFREPKEGER